jgi:hypothetical protein
MMHVAAVVASSMLLAAGAQAQTPCDQLKAVLAARIDAAGARGYSLEAVPAGTPVPPSAKVIGTCEGGASKILYRRGGAAPPTSDTPRPVSRSNEAAPAVAPAPGNGSQVERVRDFDHAVAQPQPTLPDKPAATKDPPAPKASGFMAEHWQWIGALVFVLLAAAIWVWHAYFISANDKAGLPRGSRRGTARQAALRLQALQMRRGLDQPR